MIKKIDLKYGLISFIGCLIFFCVNRYAHISDDLWFSKEATNNTDTLKWLAWRYNNWSSRVPIEFALISIINHYKIWMIFNSLFFSAAITFISTFIEDKKDKSILVISFLLCIFAIPTDVFSDSIIWMTGSINYLWPVSLMTVGVINIIRSCDYNNYIKYSLVSSSLIFFSSFNEQVAVFNTIFIVLFLSMRLYEKKTIKPLFSPAIALIIVLIIISTCPGNKNRFTLETARWFADYSNISLMGRVVLGLNLYADLLLSHKTIVPGMLCMLAAVTSTNKKMMITGLIFTLFLFISSKLTQPTSFFSIKVLDHNTVFNLTPIIRSIVATIITLVILCCLLNGREIKFKYITSILFIASIASTVVLGLSPTVYASGDRVLYVTFYVMSLVVALKTLEIFSNYKFKK